jgi:hypothetical protein
MKYTKQRLNNFNVRGYEGREAEAFVALRHHRLAVGESII